MTTDSYVASCYIENIDGQYHMECEMVTGDKKIYADYDGKNFVDGVNEIMTDITAQMLKEPEPKPQTPEEKIDSLEKLVKQLQDENKKLSALVNNTNVKNNDTMEKFKDNDDYIKDILNNDNVKDILNKYFDNYDLESLLKEIKTAPTIFHFPIK